MSGFGITGREDKYSQYLGTWVCISPYNSHETFLGKLVSMDDGDATLNPHYAQRHTKEGAEYHLIEENQLASIQSPFMIRPTTKESLEALCMLATEDAKRSLKKAREEPSKDTEKK